MKKRWNRFANAENVIDKPSRRFRIIGTAWGVALLIGILPSCRVFIVNCSPSASRGIWIAVERQLEPGCWVELHFSHDERANLPRKIADRLPNGTLLKQIIAGPGDSVRVTAGDVFVNEFPIGLPPLENAILGMILSEEITLASDEYFVVGHHPRAIDSRTFGPIHFSQIVGACRLLLCIPRSCNN